MEYFVACYVADGLRKIVREKVDIGEVLSVRGISSEIAMFINDILEENNNLHKQVVTVLEENINYRNEAVKQNIVTICPR